VILQVRNRVFLMYSEKACAALSAGVLHERVCKTGIHILNFLFCSFNIMCITLGTGHLSPRGLHEGDLEGGLLYWGPQKIC